MSIILCFLGRRLLSLAVAALGLCSLYWTLTGVMVFASYMTPPPPAVVIVSGQTHPPVSQQSGRDALLGMYQRQLEEAYGISQKRAGSFAGWMLDAIEFTGVPFPILAGVIMTESSYRYQARSHVGAIGPTQVIPRYWQKACGGDLMDPRMNIRCGAQVLMTYYRACNQAWRCTLSYYNVGPGNMTAGDPMIVAAADRYFDKVVTNMNRLTY